MAIQDSGIFSLQWKDLLKGAIIACLTTILPPIYNLLSQDHFPTWIEFSPYLKAGIASFAGYLIKNFLSNNMGDFAKKNVDVKVVPKDALIVTDPQIKQDILDNKTNQP